jgi:Mg-chelatase subunit ChlD
VLLLDVSGSIESEWTSFARPLATSCARPVPQDKISIISFRDDIQVISDFSRDRELLSRKLDEIDAGGGYCALRCARLRIERTRSNACVASELRSL